MSGAQEQEQEQEREQEVTAQTARDKAEETPWPVALLQNGMDRAGEGEGLYPLAAFGVPSLGDSDAGWTSAAQGVRTPNVDRQLPLHVSQRGAWLHRRWRICRSQQEAKEAW